MAYPQGIATFPGVDQILSATISLTHGITPAVASLEIAPQAHFTAEGGTLRFLFADTVLEFPDCKVDYFSLERDSRGLVWRFMIFDRRWQWMFGKISGRYNLRNPDGTIRRAGANHSTEKTPQELAKLCIDAGALGLSSDLDWDIGDMPDEARPEVEWDATPPMAALADLCDQVGARVILGLDNVLYIRRVGVGAELPIDGTVLQNSLTINPPEKPEKIAIACGPTWYQGDFVLEAVGIDDDLDENGNPKHTILPIDDLTYKPSGGWEIEDPLTFANTLAGRNTETGRRQQALAKQSVWRMYRIVYPIDAQYLPPVPPDAAGDFKWFGEFTGEQVETWEVDGVKQQRPAQIYGDYYEAKDGYNNNVFDEWLDERPFSFDPKKGIVTFSEQTYFNYQQPASGDAAPAVVIPKPAVLYLRTSFKAYRSDTGQWERAFIPEGGRKISGNLTPTLYVHHDEIHLNYIDAQVQNLETVTAECDHYLDAIEKQYNTPYPQTVTYAGLRAIQLDGAIQQVTYRVGQSGATTTASRNTEQLEITPSYKERRLMERQWRPETKKKSRYDRETTMANAWKGAP